MNRELPGEVKLMAPFVELISRKGSSLPMASVKILLKSSRLSIALLAGKSNSASMSAAFA
jgi:hypothetical protein